MNKSPPAAQKPSAARGEETKMRTMHVTVSVHLTIKADDDAELKDIVNELDYSFSSGTDKADIEDSEILDYVLTDSR